MRACAPVRRHSLRPVARCLLALLNDWPWGEQGQPAGLLRAVLPGAAEADLRLRRLQLAQLHRQGTPDRIHREGKACPCPRQLWCKCVCLRQGDAEGDARALVELLSPGGKLFTAMHSADADNLIEFGFPLERLPTHTQLLLAMDAGRWALARLINTLDMFWGGYCGHASTLEDTGPGDMLKVMQCCDCSKTRYWHAQVCVTPDVNIYGVSQQSLCLVHLRPETYSAT